MRSPLDRAAIRNPFFALLALVLLLLGLRIALPGLIHAQLNRLLERNPKYEGTVGDVGVALYRGAYKIHDVEIHKRGGRVPVPFAQTPLVDVSVDWGALLHGKFVGEVVADQLQLNFVAGPTEADQQSGAAGKNEWRRLVEGLFPAQLNRFEVRNGTIHFRNFRSKPPVHLELRDVDLVAGNLEDPAHLHTERAGRIEARGRFEKAGYLILHSTVDKHATEPSFNTDLIVRGVELKEWNDFLRAYANVDAEKGTVNLYAELEAKDGQFRGYAKPFFKDVELLGWDEKVAKQSPLKTAWEALVSGLLEVFKNRSEDDVAARIPITGSSKKPRGEFWPALGSALSNAWIEALKPRLEHSVGEKH